MSEWQPIETAPKDKCIMLCQQGYEPTSGEWVPTCNCWAPFSPECVFESDADAKAFFADNSYEPTHWQPLPEPPVQT